MKPISRFLFGGGSGSSEWGCRRQVNLCFLRCRHPQTQPTPKSHTTIFFSCETQSQQTPAMPRLSLAGCPSPPPLTRLCFAPTPAAATSALRCFSCMIPKSRCGNVLSCSASRDGCSGAGFLTLAQALQSVAADPRSRPIAFGTGRKQLSFAHEPEMRV